MYASLLCRCTTSVWLRYRRLSFRSNSSARAYVSACAAIDTYIGIDGVVLALRDCAHRAFVFTCTACNAVVGNFVSHSSIIFIVCYFKIINSPVTRNPSPVTRNRYPITRSPATYARAMRLSVSDSVLWQRCLPVLVAWQTLSSSWHLWRC